VQATRDGDSVPTSPWTRKKVIRDNRWLETSDTIESFTFGLSEEYPRVRLFNVRWTFQLKMPGTMSSEADQVRSGTSVSLGTFVDLFENPQSVFNEREAIQHLMA
jgi:hypothetical protein